MRNIYLNWIFHKSHTRIVYELQADYWIRKSSFAYTITTIDSHYLQIRERIIISESAPGARFTYEFSPALQIRWKVRLAVTPLNIFFCTCHDSIAVVPRTKFCSDHCIRIVVRVKPNFYRIWIATEKPLVKQIDRCHSNNIQTSIQQQQTSFRWQGKRNSFHHIIMLTIQSYRPGYCLYSRKRLKTTHGL